MFRKILVPTDGSPVSDKAVVAAIDFAATTGAAVVGLAVAQLYPFMLMPEAGAMVDLSLYEAVQDQAAQQHIAKLQATARAASVPCEGIAVRAVHAHEEIIATAKRKQCDLIWMGSHGRHGLDKFLLGSETQRVLAHSAIPVLVYREPAAQG